MAEIVPGEIFHMPALPTPMGAENCLDEWGWISSTIGSEQARQAGGIFIAWLNSGSAENVEARTPISEALAYEPEATSNTLL